MAKQQGSSFKKFGIAKKELADRFIENYQAFENKKLIVPNKGNSFYISIDKLEELLTTLKSSGADGLKISHGLKIDKPSRKIIEKSLQLILNPIIFSNKKDDDDLKHTDTEVFYITIEGQPAEPPGVVVRTTGG